MMPCYSPLKGGLISTPQGRRIVFERDPRAVGISLPCGRCIGCRLEKARQWAVRIVHESKMHLDSSFITLTYAPEHLPKDGSLSVEVCQLFLKRLRARLEPAKIRFFLAGEYGEQFARPHYHAIIFGYAFPDRVKIKDSRKSVLYSSKELETVWGFGLCSVGEVTFDSASYVANYAAKKVFGDAAASHYGARTPEFLLMSRRPGIGSSWFKKFRSDVYPSDEVIVRGVSCRPPRYYDKLLAEDNPQLMERMKLKRADETSWVDYSVSSSGVLDLVPCDGPEETQKRLAVRKAVVEAKLSLKRRSLDA